MSVIYLRVLSPGGYSIVSFLCYVLIRFLYFYTSYIASLSLGLFIVVYYKPADTLTQTLKKGIAFSVLCYPVILLVLLAIKTILFTQIHLEHKLVLGACLLTVLCIITIRQLGRYKFYRIESHFIIFKKKLPLGISCLSSVLWGDTYRVMSVVEVEELPRERIRFKQRPFHKEEHFRRMGVEEYQSEVGSYLKRCDEGVAEIQLLHTRDIRMNVRRYAIVSGRLYNSTKKSAEESLNYLCGALKALPFHLKTRIMSSQELYKLFDCLPIHAVKGKDKDILELGEGITGTSEYLGIVYLKGVPEIDAFAEESQNDRLIRACLDFNAQITFVVNFKKGKVVKEKEKYIELDADTSLSSKGLGTMLKYPRERATASDMVVAQVEGYPRVSAYLVIKTTTEAKCKRYLHEVEGIVHSIWSGMHFAPEVVIMSGRALKKAYHQAMVRSSLMNASQMSIMRLKALVHYPELPHGVGIDANFIPEFELPVQDIFHLNEGLTIGQVLVEGESVQELLLEVEDLRRSMTVLGLIGTGKTCFTKNLVVELSRNAPQVNWIVFDYKSEYSQLLSEVPDEVVKDILVLVPSSEYAPLKMNLFDPCGISAEDHADRIFSLIREVYSSMFQQDINLSVQMERILKNVLDEYIADEGSRIKGFEGFLHALDEYHIVHKKEFDALGKTVTALHNRLEKFTRGALKKIFNVSKSNITISELLEKKVIIDLGYLQSQHVPKDDIRFLMNLLARLCGDYAIKRGLQQRLCNLIIVEECQFLVPELYRKQTSIDATTTEDLSIILRAYGVGFVFIGTRPLFAENSLANSYTIVSFQLTKDAETLQKYMNLDEKQLSYLKRMRRQECLVFSPTLRYPTRVRVKDFEGEDFSKDAIERHNKQYHPGLYESPHEALEEVKIKAGEIKSFFCRVCGLNGLKPECETTRTNALSLKREHFPLVKQFWGACSQLRSDPRELFDFFSGIAPGNYSLRYCILRYVFSDYALVSKLNWQLDTYIELSKNLYRYVDTYTSQLPKLDQKTETMQDVFCENCSFEKGTSDCERIYQLMGEVCEQLRKRDLERIVFDLQNDFIDAKAIEPSHWYCYFRRLINFAIPQKKLKLSIDSTQIVKMIRRRHKLLEQRLDSIVEESCSFCKNLQLLECKTLVLEVERDLEAIDDSTMAILKQNYNKTSFEIFCNYVMSQVIPPSEKRSSYQVCFVFRLLERLDDALEETGLYEKILNIVE